jgi:hypothetical protein
MANSRVIQGAWYRGCLRQAAGDERQLPVCSRLPGFAKVRDLPVGANLPTCRERRDPYPIDRAIQLNFVWLGREKCMLMELMGFPPDDNGDALRKLHGISDDLTLPRDINFSLVFPSEEDAGAFVTVVSSSDTRRLSVPIPRGTFLGT